MEQIEKNTVPSKGQIKADVPIFFENESGVGKRVLFVGNSITLHGYRPDLGWYGWNYGMAATSKENDYVHLVIKELKKSCSDLAVCICQVVEWERSYKEGESVLPLFKKARDFDPDLLVIRLVENCPYDEYDPEIFTEQFNKLIDYFNPQNKAQLIITTGFWKHPADAQIVQVGKARGIPTVYLGDLGEDESMKAIGKFEHEGVANHPGDDGMRHIADRIINEIII